MKALLTAILVGVSLNCFAEPRSITIDAEKKKVIVLNDEAQEACRFYTDRFIDSSVKIRVIKRRIKELNIEIKRLEALSLVTVNEKSINSKALENCNIAYHEYNRLKDKQ